MTDSTPALPLATSTWDEKEYAAILKALPDLEGQALSVESAMEGELDDDLDGEA